jgi:hypothetical protein
MEHKTLTITFEKGEITNLLLRANLDETYKSLFRNACRASRRKPNAVEHGVKIVVFGAFWLETHANELMRLILNREISVPSVKKAIWDRLKRQSVLDKFSFFDSISPGSLHPAYEAIRQPTKELFDFRNRLAHFKDDPEALGLEDAKDTDGADSKIKMQELDDLLKVIPVPSMNKYLMWSSAQLFAATVKKASEWLTKVERHSDKSHKVKSETVWRK